MQTYLGVQYSNGVCVEWQWLRQMSCALGGRTLKWCEAQVVEAVPGNPSGLGGVKGFPAARNTADSHSVSYGVQRFPCPRAGRYNKL
eukprot:scaffold1669_cov129-Cylindrotheca_fusiformis.AAC.57